MAGGPGHCHIEAMSTDTSRRIVAALVAENLVEESRADTAERLVAGVLDEQARVERRTTKDAAGMPKLVEVVAYLGGALVLAAGFLFVVQQWNDLSDTARTLSLLVVTLVLAAAGVVTVMTGPIAESPARRRLAATLISGAAVTAGFTAGQALESVADFPYPEIPWPLVLGAVTATVVATVGYAFAHSAVGLVVMLGGAVFAASGLTSNYQGDEGLVMGLAFFLVAAAWLVLTETKRFVEVTVARTLGAALALFGAQFVVLAGDERWPGYLLTLVVVVVGVLLYLVVLDWPYLAVGVLGLTLLVPEVVSDWTDDSLGAVGGVLVAGVTLLVASFAGYRLRAEAEA